MGLTYESEFVFIGKGDESFLENYSYELSEDPDDKGGRIFMALEILNNQAEAEELGESLFTTLRHAFYETVDKDPYERFEEALKVVNATIESLKEEKVSRFVGNLNISIGAAVGENLFISTAGDGEVYLVRKKFVSVISEGLSQEVAGETFANIANGTLEKGDCLIFSSCRLLRYITKGEFGKLFGLVGQGQMGKALSELQDFLMTEILGRASVVGIYIGHQEQGMEGATMEDFDVSASSAEGFGGIKGAVLGLVSKLKFRMPDLNKIPKIPSGGGVSNIVSRFTGLFKGLKDVKEKMVDHMPGRKPRMSRQQILVIASFALILLVVAVFWLRSYTSEQTKIAEQQAKLSRVNELVNEASTVGQFDKPKASEMLATAKQEAVLVLNSRILKAQAIKALDDVQAATDGLDSIQRVKDPTVLVDLSAKKPTVSALGLLNLKDRLYGFDFNTLYEVVLDKLQEPTQISDIETVILGTTYEDKGSLLLLTRTGKLIEYLEGQFLDVPTKDGVWKKGVDIKSYNERVYILDAERNQVWRYQRRREGFDEGEGYNLDADLKNAVSLAIDSSIYVLNSDGTIIQLYQGHKQDFPLRRAPLTAVTAPTKIYTSAELNHIFILEPTNSRVLLYRKDPKNGGAQYQSQYVFQNTGALRDLLVYDNRLYVMDDKRIYMVNLSGL